MEVSKSVCLNSVNPGFSKRYISFDASSERTADVGFKPVRQGYFPGGLCLWMQKALKTPALKQNPCKSVLICGNKLSAKSAKSASKNRVHLCNLWLFLCKTNPILSAVANSKSLCGKQLYHIYNFVESQFKPNSNPIQTQFKPNFHPPKPWRRRTKPNLGNMGNIGYALEGGYIGGLLGFVVSFFFETCHLFGVFRHRLLGLVIFLRTGLRLFLFLLVRDVVVYAVSNPAYDNQRKSDY